MPRARGDSKQIEDAARLRCCWGLRVRGSFSTGIKREGGMGSDWGGALHLIGATHDVLANFAYGPTFERRR